MRVRTDCEFSFEKEAYGLIQNQINNFFDVHMNVSHGKETLQPSWLEQEFDLNPFSEVKLPNSYGLKELYFNTVHMNYALKKIEKINILFKNKDFSSPQDMEPDFIKAFADLNEDLKIKDLWKMGDKMQSKYYKLLEGLKSKKVFNVEQEKSNSGLDF